VDHELQGTGNPFGAQASLLIFNESLRRGKGESVPGGGRWEGIEQVGDIKSRPSAGDTNQIYAVPIEEVTRIRDRHRVRALESPCPRCRASVRVRRRSVVRHLPLPQRPSPRRLPATAPRATLKIGNDCSTCRNSVNPAPSRLYRHARIARHWVPTAENLGHQIFMFGPDLP